MEKLISDQVKKQVQTYFQDLKNEVVLVFFGSKTGNCEYCALTRQLLEELAGLSEKISLEIFDLEEDPAEAARYGVDKAPGIVIAGRENDQLIDYRIRFYGIPSGGEFTALVNDIVMVARRDSGLAAETRKFLSSLTGPINLQVFVTPSCPHCPRAVVLAHQMALESALVEADGVEATEFSALAEQYGVAGVPHTAINFGAGEMIGAAPEAYLVEQIKQALK
jgi:glutaredoxin-like protein